MSGTGACSLVGGTGSCPSDGQDCVKACVYRQLWAQEVFKQPVCSWVGLCSCPVGLTSSIPALEPTGCWMGQVLVSKWQPPGQLTPLSTPQYLHHQCPCLFSEPQPPPASTGDPSRPESRSGTGSYEVTAFSLHPSAHRTLCAPSKSGVSVSPSPVEFL